jgi:hypothetical protein
MKECTPQTKSHGAMNGIFSAQDIDINQIICPYCIAKTELCLAALASSMIDKQGCGSAGYKVCAIFSINGSRR